MTEKADGIRKLMFITKEGKVYFIPTTMSIEFTGIVIKDKSLFNPILDAEHILHDKNGGYFDT